MEEKDQPQSELTFEQAMARLEELVATLEEDGLGLEESLTHYETGMALARLCLDRLNSAELRVRELSLDPPDATL